MATSGKASRKTGHKAGSNGSRISSKTSSKTSSRIGSKTSSKASSKTSSKSTGGTSATRATAGLPSLGDLGKVQFKLPSVDVSAIVESRRKGFEALAHANRQAYEGIQSLARRRNEML